MKKEKQKKYEEYNPIYHKAVSENPQWMEYAQQLDIKLKKIQHDQESFSWMSDLSLNNTIEIHIADNFECGLECAKKNESDMLKAYEDHLKINKQKRDAKNTPEEKHKRKLEKTKHSLDFWESELQQHPDDNLAQHWTQLLKKRLQNLESKKVI